jgi:hypothetical protein
MRLELNDIQTEALIRELTQIIDNDRLSPQSPHCGAERDPRDAATGARTRGPAAPTTALRAAGQGAV